MDALSEHRPRSPPPHPINLAVIPTKELPKRLAGGEQGDVEGDVKHFGSCHCRDVCFEFHGLGTATVRYGFGVTAHCIDKGTVASLEVRTFDGVNWETEYAATGIAAQTAVQSVDGGL
eukprot:gene14645-15897_t